MTPEQRQLAKELHPDLNGGDHSRVGEFIELMKKARRRMCGRTGCSNPLLRKETNYCSQLCWKMAHFYDGKIAACLALLLAFSASAQSAFKTALDAKVAADRAAAVALPQTVSATLEWNGAPGETNTFNFGGYVLSWSTNVDMNNAAVVLLPVTYSYRFTNLPPAQTYYFTCSSYGKKGQFGEDRGIQVAPPAKLTWNRTEPPPAQAFIYVEGGTNSASGPFYGVDDLPQYVITNLTLRPYGIWRARIEYK